MNISDIFQEARDLGDADATSYPDATLLRRVNTANEDVVGSIIRADGTWQFDDTNYTTNPIGTGTLIDGQSSYTFSDKFLDIENVKVKDTNGNWHLLTPIDQSQTPMALEQYLTTSGMPAYYDKSGNTIKLYPAPASAHVTLASGLKVQFKRTADLFTSGDVSTGTKEPGFAINHVILAYKAALPYCARYKPNSVGFIMAEIKRLLAEIIKHYSSREADRRKVITTKPISHR